MADAVDMLADLQIPEFAMAVERSKHWLIASDVAGRDGIGVELYVNGNLVVEIFRDDTKRTREVTLYEKDVPLEYVEEAISKFKTEIPREFLD